jgi:OOP family OmpA-OmpF porin
MSKKWLISTLGAAAMIVSTGALAQAMSMATVPNFYAGAEVGQADFGTDDDTAFKILGGYQFHTNIAAEIGYGMLFDKNSAEVTSLEAVAVGIFPLANQFSIIGKLGFANVDVETPVGSDDKTELTYGVGVQYDFNRNLGLRAQWQRYDTDEEVDLISIGAVWRF